MAKIVFLDTHAYPFRDASYENEGVGGSEASLILLARALARAGLDVHVYLTHVAEEVASGVKYHPLSTFRPDEGCDVFVLFRHPYDLAKVKASRKIFWSTDGLLPTKEYSQAVIPYADKVVGISNFHTNLLRTWFPEASGKILHLPLGVTLSEYSQAVPKVPGQAIYCSVAGRGLPELLAMAPSIARKVPGFKLVITSDYGLWRLNGHVLDVTAKAEAAQLPFVEYCGRLPRAQLVRRQLESQVMAYPCTFEECFCISAMECMAAGAVPVTSCRGALPATVGMAGVKIQGIPGTPSFNGMFIDEVASVLTDASRRAGLEAFGRRTAAGHDWSAIALLWRGLLEL